MISKKEDSCIPLLTKPQANFPTWFEIEASRNEVLEI